ncbi:MAG TPA: UDP-3-O-(3-hydroxymyristoyl)glucosamine N-acyltransferase [Quisquiliibacterium sp.]|nr:UDP-3-O-(3-hydroxymyristoyl)glucosamine N-acyltransferase [Quisquiliibacterium sp.]
MARSLAAAVSVAELVRRFGGEVSGAADRGIRGLATLHSAGPSDLSFLSAAKYRAEAAVTHAGAVVVAAAQADVLPPGCVRIVVGDPYAHFAAIARWFAEQVSPAVAPAGVHASACVAPGASLGDGVRIAAHCVIDDGARIGDGAVLGAGCVIGPGAVIGAGTVLAPNVTVYHDCSVGARGIVHAGTVIGADGFGFAREQGRWAKIPQLGAVRIGDDVEIGANCTIDRGALDDTVIGDGCKIDNLVQIAHNVRIGEHTALAGCVGVAGSAVIGRRCMIGGSAGILGHLEICDDVVISAMSLVTRSITTPGFYSGVYPLMPNADWERSAAVVRQLPALRRRIRQLDGSATGRGRDSPTED